MQLHGKSIETERNLHYTQSKPELDQAVGNLYPIQRRFLPNPDSEACALILFIAANIYSKYYITRNCSA